MGTSGDSTNAISYTIKIVVIELKLALERSIGDPSALTQQLQNLLEHSIEVHFLSDLWPTKMVDVIDAERV